MVPERLNPLGDSSCGTMLFENRPWKNNPIKCTGEVLSQTETKKNESVANQPEARQIIAAV